MIALLDSLDLRLETLGECGAEQQVGRARAGLEFGLEQQTLRVGTVGGPGRELDAEQERGLGARRGIVQEPVLPEQREITEPGGITANSPPPNTSGCRPDGSLVAAAWRTRGMARTLRRFACYRSPAKSR